MRVFIVTLIMLTTGLSSQNMTITVYTDNPSNKVAKFERDIITNIFKLRDTKSKSKTTINFVELKSFQEAFYYMDQNKDTDLKNSSFAINKISFTAERAKKYDFSNPYMLNYYSVMTLQESTQLHSIKSFDTKYSYGAVKATLFEDKLNTINGLTVKTYPAVKDMNAALQSKKVDFIVTDYVDSWEFGLKSIYFYDDTTDRLCILLPKGSTLKKELDSLLKYYTKSQQFFKLVKDNFGNDAVRFFKQSKS